MPNAAIAHSCWRTSSFGAHADTLPTELADLGAHLGKCKHANGRLAALQSFGHATSGFVHSRMVTTMLAVAALIGITYLLS